MFQNKTGVALKDLLESKKTEGACAIINEGLKTKKFTPEIFSLKEIWEACQEYEGQSTNVLEAIVSSSFPKITGELINAKVIAGYDDAKKVGDMLTTTTRSNQKIDTYAGFTAAEMPDLVAEGAAYQSSTLTEKYVTAEHLKYGKMLDITEEMIMFDQTGMILRKAQGIGAKNAQWRESLIVKGVQDLNTNVYRPAGTATALYSATNGNLVTTNPFGEAGMEKVQRTIQLMTDDSIGTTPDDYIFINEDNAIVLVPQELRLEAWQLANAVLTPESGENAPNWYKGKFEVVTSPWVTSNDDTTWYYGDFKNTFTWSEIWPLQMIGQRAGNDAEFERDIKARFKTRFFGTILAQDFRLIYKNTT